MKKALTTRKLKKAVKDDIKWGLYGKAVELYKSKKISLGLGAKLAGVPLGEFLDLLKLHNADLNITQEDVEDALKAARKVL